jgi:acyl-CoA dehydrogenase
MALFGRISPRLLHFSRTLSINGRLSNEPTRNERMFSSSSKLSLMGLSGFTETQLTVREAVMKRCSQFPDDYWAQMDQKQQYPHDFHAAMAQDGWIGIALPEELGGGGLGVSEATMLLHTISEYGMPETLKRITHSNTGAVLA